MQIKSIDLEKNELFRLNERFVRDFSFKIGAINSPFYYFHKRLEQYELYKNGTIGKYNDFLDEFEKNFESVNEYYDVRNQFISEIIADQESRQLKYNLKGNSLTEYSFEQHGISSRDIYNESNLGKTLISVDLKAASFQALKFFNPLIVNNCKNYEDYVFQFTNIKNFSNKHIRSTSFGKTCNNQIYKIEKFLTSKALEIVLHYEPVENVICFNSDEVVFLKTDNFENILKDIQKLSEDIDVIFDIEEFSLKKIKGLSGSEYIKDIFDFASRTNRIDICGVNSIDFPFVLCALYDKPVDEAFLYFQNKDGYLCKFIDYPIVTI